jgi:predicted Zn-dependent protease
MWFAVPIRNTWLPGSSWREDGPHNSLGNLYARTGDWEKALPELQEAVRLEPRSAINHSMEMLAYWGLGRFDEARAVAEKAFAQKLDFSYIHMILLMTAYVQGDRAEAEKQIQWLAGKPEEFFSLLIQAGNAAVFGQLRQGEGYFQRAREITRQQGLAETAAGIATQQAVQAALVGNCEAARATARAAILPDQAPPIGYIIPPSPLPLALCGDVVTAQRAADETSQRYPAHTIWNSVYLPSIRAAIELSRNQAEQAVALLQSATPYERAYPFAVYLRGLAYLRLRKGAEAAAEFQKILDHKGVNWGAYYPLSYVGLARAAALTGDTPRARKAYQDFLALWKDADPDIPILKEAKAEYAKLK